MSDAPQKEHQSLRVQVGRVLTYNDDTGFVAMVCFDRDLDEVRVVGTYHEDPRGQNVVLHGNFENDPRRGRQFRASYIEPQDLFNPDRVAAYLASLGIPYIGPAIAKDITAQFGPTTFSVLTDDPERLEFVPRVRREAIDFIKKNWKGLDAYREMILFLMDVGVPSKKVPEIRRKLCMAAKELIQRDPYILAREISGFGFKKADAIAQAFGIARDSDVRKRALTDHLLREAQSDGMVGMPVIELCEKMMDMLGSDL